MALPSFGRMSDGSLTSRSDSDSEEVGKGHCVTVSQHLFDQQLKPAKFDSTDGVETSPMFCTVIHVNN